MADTDTAAPGGSFCSGSTAPQILIFSADESAATCIRDVCTELACVVAVAASPPDAILAARKRPFQVVFLDADMGERRISDVIQSAKLQNPGLACLLLATPDQVEASPTLLMMVGHEYMAKPLHAATVSAEIRLRLDQQRTRRVSAALASTLEYRGLLDVLMQLAVQEVTAHTASLLMPRNEEKTLHLEAARGLPDAVVADGHQSREDGIAEWVFEQGEPLILQGGFIDLPLTSVAEDRPIASAMVIPLLLGTRRLGVLCVARVGTEADPFTLRELRAMEIIALQAAVAIHNAVTHRTLLEREVWEHELEIARAVQQHLLPREFPNLPRVAIQAVNLPARQIGGDFYNVFRLGDSRIGFVIGDVSGKGIPGALLMTQTMNDMHRAVEAGARPSEVLAYINDTVANHSTRGMFVTLFYGVIDLERGVLEYANAGHLPMLVLKHSGEAGAFVGQAQDPPLGILPGTRFTAGEMAVAEGDSLVLFTDGVVEAKNPEGDEYGFDRLIDLSSVPGHPAATLVEHITLSVQDFAASRAQHDDLTLLAIQVHSRNGR